MYSTTFFKSRQYLSGFTGSAGLLLVLQDSAYLWTDGRYYIQAQKQLEGKAITLMKQGMPGVPSVAEFLNDNLYVIKHHNRKFPQLSYLILIQ